MQNKRILNLERNAWMQNASNECKNNQFLKSESALSSLWYRLVCIHVSRSDGPTKPFKQDNSEWNKDGLTMQYRINLVIKGLVGTSERDTWMQTSRYHKRKKQIWFQKLIVLASLLAFCIQAFRLSSKFACSCIVNPSSFKSSIVQDVSSSGFTSSHNLIRRNVHPGVIHNICTVRNR